MAENTQNEKQANAKATLDIYKDTLNLPKTSFAMKASLAQREPERLKFWQDIDIYNAMLQQREGAEKFIVADGPPYANGNIHIGHALNKILKDIIVKAKHLSGYFAPYIPGWDCHGLPIELKVEKKVGKPGQKVDAKTFRKKCREYAQTQIDAQRKSFMRLGVLGDWDNYYNTMDYKFEANIIRTLGKVIGQGHLHREDRPVHWCLDCSSALAEAELEYKDKQSSSIDVAFPVCDAKIWEQLFSSKAAKDKTSAKENSTTEDSKALGKGQIYVVIWTTTPWTLPANQAVTVHANLAYVLVQLADKRIVVAKDLLLQVMERLAVTDYQVLAECSGGDLEKQELQHPFLERKVPIILGEHVTTEAGTGCVHTAPAHGYDDYLVCKHYEIVLANPVGANGCFLPEIPFVGGKHIKQANEELIQLLQDKGVLLSNQQIIHSYPHCWRHKTPLIFRATPQWFISMDQHNLRQQALVAIKKVKWVPGWGEARIAAMLQGRPDWCISRQRTWGTPIPLFVHKDSGELHPDTIKLIEKVALKVEKAGIEAWYEIDQAEFLGAEVDDYIKSADTLDVWFDSGAYHECVAKERSQLNEVVDVYLEGSDQHRGWFQASLLSSIATKHHAPYKEVLTHGFIIDTERNKMSKSLDNALAPEKIMNTLGADVLRLWVAATDYRSDLHVSDEILKRISDSYRRIRNTARFLLANLDGFDLSTDMVAPDEMLKLDSWVVARTAALQAQIIADYNAYQFHLVYQKLQKFCVDELGSFYLDIIKDRQYTCKADGIPRRSAQTAMYYVIEALARWIAPILSFTAEEIWQHIPGERSKSVFLSEWLQNIPVQAQDEELDNDFWQQVLEVRTAVNKELENLRASNVIGSALEAEVDLYCDADLFNKLKKLGKELRFVLITSQARVHLLAEAQDSVAANLKATDLANLKLAINKSSYEKCSRCWHRCEDVNSNSEYPGICRRCVENLTVGEQRVFA